MKLGINAFNIRAGGGLVHLIELLSAVNPHEYGFSEIIVWAGTDTINQLPNKNWLTKISVEGLNTGWFYKTWWLFYKFPKEAQQCDILFFPGGSYWGTFKPFVTMLQNMLPFDAKEARRYLSFSVLLYMKWKLLYLSQSLTLKRATGAIYPSLYSKNYIIARVDESHLVKDIVIPHGINMLFSRSNNIIEDDKCQTNIRLLYVSVINVYKHQWHVIDAVNLLRQRGINVSLDLVGPISNKYSGSLLAKAISRVDPDGDFIHYLGEIPYQDLPAIYQAADIFVFASSCESISNIILEAMKTGLPIACSNRSVMPEVLGDAGVYFDPENPLSIADSINLLIDNPTLRIELAAKAADRVSYYSWEKCAQETFSFIANVAESAIYVNKALSADAAKLIVVILTYNEEIHIERAINNVLNFADKVIVLDSYSEDETVAKAQALGVEVIYRKFDNYRNQRQYAIDQFKNKTQWMLFLDADEYLSVELKVEIKEAIKKKNIAGYYIPRKFIFMDKWIRFGGYYPTYLLRLFRPQQASIIRDVNEHITIDGKVAHLKHDFSDHNLNGINHWINKHNHYATFEAEELFAFKLGLDEKLKVNFFIDQASRKQWLRYKIWNRLPIIIRPCLYYFYRYVLRLGFLDGRAGFIYHFLQGYWFYFLIDVKYFELKKIKKDSLMGKS